MGRSPSKPPRAYAFWLHVHAVALKRSATGYEGRLRGLFQPAAAGLAMLAGGFSLRRSENA
jgi:hypothetical protein